VRAVAVDEALTRHSWEEEWTRPRRDRNGEAARLPRKRRALRGACDEANLGVWRCGAMGLASCRGASVLAATEELTRGHSTRSCGAGALAAGRGASMLAATRGANALAAASSTLGRVGPKGACRHTGGRARALPKGHAGSCGGRSGAPGPVLTGLGPAAGTEALRTGVGVRTD
jgi:hypothetical protein